MKWLISAETIAEYRSIPHIDFHDNSLFIGDSGNPTQQIMDDFCVRYTGGQLTLDSLIAELSRTMENKGEKQRGRITLFSLSDKGFSHKCHADLCDADELRE